MVSAVMATAFINERRNKQIQDAIDVQNFKQALQLCEKRIKKGEDTHFLRVRPLDVSRAYASFFPRF